MTVVKALPGVKITIWSNGHQLKEYKSNTRLLKEAANKHVHRFIKAITDAEFSIKIIVDGTYQLDSPSLLFAMYVDGTSVGGILCGKVELIHGCWTKNIEGVKQPTEKRTVVGLRKFQFSELPLEQNTGPAKLAQDRQSALRMGEILVQVHRCSPFYALSRAPFAVREELPPISSEALENREISHGTTYSPTKKILDQATLHDVTYVDGEDNPLAVFNFSYRSKDILERELLRQAFEAESEQRTAGKKRKRTEQVVENEDVVEIEREDVIHVLDDDDIFVPVSPSARNAGKSAARTGVEVVNLNGDLEDD